MVGFMHDGNDGSGNGACDDGGDGSDGGNGDDGGHQKLVSYGKQCLPHALIR
jgi:hypothetical protein